MIVFELLFLNAPYSECENSYEISERIISNIPPEQPFELSSEYLPFLYLFRACTTWQPKTRPTATDLVGNINTLPNSKNK